MLRLKRGSPVALALCVVPLGCRSHTSIDASYTAVAADLLARMPAGRRALLSPASLDGEQRRLPDAVLDATGVPLYRQQPPSDSIALLRFSSATTRGDTVVIVGGMALPYVAGEAPGGHTLYWQYHLLCDRDACKVTRVLEHAQGSWILGDPS